MKGTVIHKHAIYFHMNVDLIQLFLLLWNISCFFLCCGVVSKKCSLQEL